VTTVARPTVAECFPVFPMIDRKTSTPRCPDPPVGGPETVTVREWETVETVRLLDHET
jgi:hypothetical protein